MTVPGQTWTYRNWNKGLGPGETYLETDYKYDWSKSTGKLMAHNLVVVARASQVTPSRLNPERGVRSELGRSRAAHNDKAGEVSLTSCYFAS